MAGRPVLQVIASTDRRGAEVFAVGLQAELVARGRTTHTVALAPGHGASEKLAVATLGPAPLSPATLVALRRRLGDCAVVIAHGSLTLPACAMASLGSATEFVYRNIGDPRYWAGTVARRARVRLLLSRARAVAVLWTGAADSLMAKFGVPASKIRVIPNGVPSELFPEVDERSRAAARASLGYDGNSQLVLYLGALSREKDVGAAVRAVATLGDVRLLVAGDGPDRPALEALAREVAPGRVHFLGAVADTARILAAADALVLSSLTEGIPAVLVEAGMSGLPVVATDVGGVREVVVDDETGLLVPPQRMDALAGALRRVLDQPGTLGRSARQRCLSRFDLGVVATSWDCLLEDLGYGRPSTSDDRMIV